MPNNQNNGSRPTVRPTNTNANETAIQATTPAFLRGGGCCGGSGRIGGLWALYIDCAVLAVLICVASAERFDLSVS